MTTDPAVGLLYYLFREHHLTPGQFKGLPAGEKILLRAFFEYEMEARQ